MGVRYIDLGAVDLKRLSLVQYTRTRRDAATPLPTVCPPAPLVPTGAIYSDDFNRANADTLGVDWEEFFDNINPVQNFPWMGIRANQVRCLASPPAPPPDTSPLTKAAYFIPMPTTTKDQLAKVIFQGSSLIATGGPANAGFGGCLEILCRCNLNTAPAGNHWYEAGAGGGGTQAGIICYVGRYIENYDAAGAFVNAVVDINRNELLGFAGITATVPVTRMAAGDELMITAANFLSGGVEGVCLKLFINGVLKSAGNDFSNAIPGIQAGRQLTGRGGLADSIGFTAPNPLAQAFVVQMLCDNFEAQACLPNPV